MQSEAEPETARTTAETAEERFNRVMREYGPAWSRLAFGYERGEAAREELVQEIALAVWQALRHFRGECSERTFIYRIAHNRGLTHAYRREAAHHTLDDLPESLEPVDPSPLPEEEVSMTHRRNRLRSAIQRLPLACREAVMLMLEDLSHAEIAEILGISESNVAVRMNRARKALRDTLGERP